MFRKFASTSLATLVICAAALGAVSLASAGPAEAYDGYGRHYDRPSYGWRPAPPVVHGYWGQRHWRRYGQEERRYFRHGLRHDRGFGWR